MYFIFRNISWNRHSIAEWRDECAISARRVSCWTRRWATFNEVLSGSQQRAEWLGMTRWASHWPARAMHCKQGINLLQPILEFHGRESLSTKYCIVLLTPASYLTSSQCIVWAGQWLAQCVIPSHSACCWEPLSASLKVAQQRVQRLTQCALIAHSLRCSATLCLFHEILTLITQCKVFS